jgi:TonB family protein
MNKTILFLLIVIPTFVLGQDTKKITDKENNETFYVLKSDKTTKHGEYKKFSYNNKLLVKGFYKQGVKDSIWECYDFEGQLTLKYNYNKSEVIVYKPNEIVKDKKYKILNSKDTILSRTPIFLYGDDYVSSEIIKNIRYPSSAIDNGKSGKVYVVFTIDKYGKTSNYHVDEPIGYGMDEEAIRVLKLLPDNWLPGLLNGQTVDVEVVCPINFILE